MNRLEYTPFTGAYSISIDVSQANPGDRIYLPDTPVLSDKFITAMTVFGISYSSSNVQDPDGNVISSNNVGQFFVTLVDLKNDDFISNIPLFYFMYGGRQIPINRYLVLPNCYLTKPKTGNTQHILLTFYYTYTPESLCKRQDCFEKLKIQSVNIPVYSNSANKYYLPDNRVLVDKKFKNIYATIISSDVSSPDSIPIVAPINSFLTLIYKSDIILYRFPVLYLSQWNSPFRLNMDNLQADLPSSYIELSQDIAQTVGDKVVFLNFEYED